MGQQIEQQMQAIRAADAAYLDIAERAKKWTKHFLRQDTYEVLPGSIEIVTDHFGEEFMTLELRANQGGHGIGWESFTIPVAALEDFDAYMSFK